jgi:single-strand DNA-binding protein
MAVVQGRLQIRGWTDKDGNKRKAAEVVADNVYFADSNKDSHAPNRATQGNVEPQYGYATGGYTPYGSSAIGQPPQGDFVMLDDDQTELPF